MRTVHRRTRVSRAFTLVELLVVIAIIGVLIALLLPAVQAAREAARRTACLNNMKQNVLGILTHADTLKYFPASATSGDAKGWGASYVFQVLPYIEEQNVYDLFDRTTFIGAASNRPGWSREMTVVRCPSQTEDDEISLTENQEIYSSPPETSWRSHYLAVMGAKDGCPQPSGSPYTMLKDPDLCDPAYNHTGGAASNGVMYPESSVRFKDITDGTSNTLLVGESSWHSGRTRVWAVGSIASPARDLLGGHSWATYGGRNVALPINTQSSRRETGTNGLLANDISFGSVHPGGTIFGLCDGSSRFISENIDLVVYKALASRNVGEVVDAEN